jgi:hypothetical protein
MVSTHAVPQVVRLQVDLHAPAEHQKPGAQALPQRPQLLASLEVSTHLPEHRVPVAHAHALLLQIIPIAHAWLQPPQFIASLVVLTHEVPQRAVPVGHAVAMQVPPVHTWPVEQRWLHAPQLAPSVIRFTQAPAHGVVPFAQTCIHDPFVHVWPVGQACVQVPQCNGFVIRS